MYDKLECEENKQFDNNRFLTSSYLYHEIKYTEILSIFLQARSLLLYLLVSLPVVPSGLATPECGGQTVDQGRAGHDTAADDDRHPALLADQVHG